MARKGRYKNPNYHRDYYQANKERFRAWHRRRRARPESKDTYLDYRLRYNFGITLVEYRSLLARQDYRCLGCGRSQSDVMDRFAVDHDHTTGKIRGLLCRNCNSALGLAGDSPEILRRLAAYVEVHSNSRILQTR